ncbi:CGNR zinc finger domain-containing protein [Asanoa sp. WMMD1127]|uniref:CGNR zinc finger domain-containing protein n=1 Tax=Asanoa sp. WMMD1127 TaxID=3016107 RepID=UPI0024162394|nr:CGNR zinc finger domain-containing protein [Asanoa sp. WMMD1127]MDG4825861.1 CGNR zinc finger domain-containing protein [Asanoa sp. WMMD1127]
MTAFGYARWAALATALVNTEPGRRHPDLLTAPADLAALLRAHDEPEPVDPDGTDLRDAREARKAFSEIFDAAPTEAALATKLNALLARSARPRLVTHAGVPLHLHVDAPGSSWGGWLAASGAMGLALLVAEHGADVLGRCAAPDCRDALVRTGGGPARRFCSATCASRVRVAAHRAAARAQGRGGNPAAE